MKADDSAEATQYADDFYCKSVESGDDLIRDYAIETVPIWEDIFVHQNEILSGYLVHQNSAEFMHSSGLLIKFRIPSFMSRCTQFVGLKILSTLFLINCTYSFVTFPQTSKDLNLTGSVLSYHPKIEDQGKFLSCRAENLLIPDSGVEKGFKLNLHRKFVQLFEA